MATNKLTASRASATTCSSSSSATSSYATFKPAQYELVPPAPSTAEQALHHHPASQTSCFGDMMMTWTTPLMTLGNHKQLDLHDVWPLQPRNRSFPAYCAFVTKFQQNQSIVWSYFTTFSWPLVMTGVLSIVTLGCGLFGPIALNGVMSALALPADQFDPSTLTKWILRLFASKILAAICTRYATFMLQVVGIRFSAALRNLVYEKTLKLSAESRKAKTAGTLLNLYSFDITTLVGVAQAIHQVWLIPAQVIVALVMLFMVIGKSSMAAILMIVFLCVLNQWLTVKVFECFVGMTRARDVRLKDLSEVFKSIMVVKFTTTEETFLAKIKKVWNEELDQLWESFTYTAASMAIATGIPVFLCVFTFGAHVLVFDQELTAATVFTCLSLFRFIQPPIQQLSGMIQMFAIGRVSLNRLKDFLKLSELDPNSVMSLQDPLAQKFVNRGIHISIRNGAFAWEHDDAVLRDVNLEIRHGELVVLHGKVGSGKSSLCSAILGEMIKLEGTVFVGGNIAHCSQQPWVQNMTIRENILFGKPYDEKKYNKVLEACALTHDIKVLEDGDQTEVVERGANLSIGQKARIALARACYSDADLFVLDSPFAALDAIVQNEIFQKCVLGLLRNKTVLLVTHNSDIIESKYAHRSLEVNDIGSLALTRDSCEAVEHIEEPLISPLAFHGFQSTLQLYEQLDEPEVEEFAVERMNSGILLSPCNAMNERHQQQLHVHLIKEEERSRGRVDNHVFIACFHSIGGWPVMLVVVFVMFLWQSLQTSSDFWLGQWSMKAGSISRSGYQKQIEDLLVYAGLGLTAALMMLLYVMIFAKSAFRGTNKFFVDMTNSLLFAPMRFFDTNPIGRILNRYSTDIMIIITELTSTFIAFLISLLTFGTIMSTAAVIIRWYGLALIPVLFVYIRLAIFYLAPARELQRMQWTTVSPMLSHISETFDGISTVRASGSAQLQRFRDVNDDRIDTANRVAFAVMCSSQWFTLRMQFLGALFILFITWGLVALRDQISIGVLGVVFTYALSISDMLSAIIQSWSMIETTMVSPERLLQYIGIPPEAERRNPTHDPSAASGWPQHGHIAFEQVNFRYGDDDPLVLKGATFDVEPQEKIGIVGRTGAGKSSLMMALFRINEVASGSIKIDGVDVSKIGLKTLREKISIIPQVPVLFRGSLRSFLDPLGDYEDAEIWHAIKLVGLYDRIACSEGKLECEVEENGENFSVGERQMLCMARALLTNARIVVLDEATASMDRETDQRLQQVIHEAFKDATVLTIAHRLDTILHCDRILVMDKGKVVDFETPEVLMGRGDGHFCALMREGGYLA